MINLKYLNLFFRKLKTINNIFQKSIDLDKRPKWGVNRPEVQYIKQSDKDPYYQLKFRQKSPWNNRRTSNVNSAKSPSNDRDRYKIHN